MKYLVAILLFVNSFCFSQKDTSSVYTIVEQMPEFPGGMAEMMKFIQGNLKYPQDLAARKIGGKVYVKFIIGIDGTVEQAEVLKSSGFDKLDNEAIRVVKIMPDWTSGVQNGKKVRVYFNLPLSFSLQEPYYIFNVNNVNPYYKESLKALTTGTPAQVIDMMKQALKVAPKDADIFYNRGVAHYYSNKGSCCRDFMAVLEFVDSNSPLYVNCKKYVTNYCK
ncbi:MAG TPA: TonB family protein [Bacteroidia bacterium]|nr:TonB family protein [Bacteroidia bacterium]